MGTQYTHRSEAKTPCITSYWSWKHNFGVHNVAVANSKFRMQKNPQFLIHCLILHSTQSLELSKVEERLYQDKYNKCHCSLQPQENNEWMYYFWKKQLKIKFVLATQLLGNSFNFLSTVCITIWGKLWTSTLICRAKKYLMIPNNSYPLVVVTINTILRFPANK